MLRGDWGYVIVGYGLTALVLGVYVARLFSRASTARRRLERLRSGPR